MVGSVLRKTSVKSFVVASFADRPHAGNPAGVVILRESLAASQLQSMASELNQPETAFLYPNSGTWHVRWFSPIVEVELCGHATLAAAHVLWQEGHANEADELHFYYSAGDLSARLYDGSIWLNFPTTFGQAEPAADNLLACVDVQPLSTARHSDRWIFEYPRAQHVRSLRPDFAALKATGVRSLIATAPSDMRGYDIVSRNFAPIVGVNEDQATGTAHTCLAPFWQARLGDSLRCWQASRRGGTLLTRLKGVRTELGGTAVIEEVMSINIPERT